MVQKSNTEESILIGELLSLMSFAVTSSLEKFSSWLLVGFGAAFALILSNIEIVSKFIPVQDIKTGVLLYLIALASGVIQRWLAVGVMAGAMASKEAKELGANASDTVNINNVLTEIENVTLYPQKWFIRYQYNKLRRGDLAATGRMLAVMAQLQSYLVLIQGGLVISSIIVMVFGINA